MHFNFRHQTFNLKKLLGHPGKFIHYVAPLKTFLFLHSYYPKHPYHPSHQGRLVWSPWSLRCYLYTQDVKEKDVVDKVLNILEYFGPNFHLVLIQPKIPFHLVERAVPTRSLICRRAGHQIWARTCFSRLMEEFVIWEDSGPQTGFSFFIARLASSCSFHANQSHK